MAKRSKKYIKNQQLVQAVKAEKFVPLALVEETVVRHFTPYICGAQVKEKGQPVTLEWYNYKQFEHAGQTTANGELKTYHQIAEECKAKPWVVWASGKHPYYFATRKEAEQKIKQIALGE